MKIGILSDTHGHWDEQGANFFEGCELILHAGDIGSERVADSLQALHPLRAVVGNIDGYPLRERYPTELNLELEGLGIYMTHIAGAPGHYSAAARKAVARLHPKLLIGGHSHILRVIPDRTHGLLYINPGAYGHIGIHTVRTALRVVITPEGPANLEVLELPKGNNRA